MDISSFLDWLFSPAGSGWALAILSLGGLAFTLWKRQRPRRIIVREANRLSLIRIDPRARKSIEVRFQGQVVKALSEIELELSNTGSKPIEDATVTVMLPKNTSVLATYGRGGSREIRLNVDEDQNGNKVDIDIPYLNPRREHDDVVKVGLLCDGYAAPFGVSGGGSGWSVGLTAPPTRRQLKRRSIIAMAALFIELIGFIFYMYWIESQFGIPGEMSLTVFLAMLPPFLVLAATNFLAYRYVVHPLRRNSVWPSRD